MVLVKRIAEMLPEHGNCATNRRYCNAVRLLLALYKPRSIGTEDRMIQMTLTSSRLLLP